MKRSSEFNATVKHGVRAVQPDIVVHARRGAEGPHGDPGPRIGLVIGKTVGSAVQRHRVARRLRHVALTVIGELDGGDRVVIRALPSCREAIAAGLEQQLWTGLQRAGLVTGARR
jgi:ribonuclease P protein component